MFFPGIMHVQANLLNGICNVRPGECQILEGAHKAAVGSRVSHRGTGISRNLSTSVNRCGTWFAVAHAMASKYVQTPEYIAAVRGRVCPCGAEQPRQENDARDRDPSWQTCSSEQK